MSLDPDDIARRLQHRHWPGWSVWHGRATRHYWALASWVPGLAGMLSAATPDALDAAIAIFVGLHPKPAHWYVHAVDPRRIR
jgi:hypothetical protein